MSVRSRSFVPVVFVAVVACNLSVADGPGSSDTDATTGQGSQGSSGAQTTSDPTGGAGSTDTGHTTSGPPDACDGGLVWAEPPCNPMGARGFVPKSGCYEPCEGSGDTSCAIGACERVTVESLCPCPPGGQACCEACATGKPVWLCLESVIDPSVTECPNDAPADPLTLDAAAVEGDRLVLSVGYGGGCEAHDMTLCWDGSFAESSPVQVALRVSHDAHGDHCEAYVTEPLRFSLEPLAEAYRAGYRMDSGEVVLNLDGWAESLLFKF